MRNKICAGSEVNKFQDATGDVRYNATARAALATIQQLSNDNKLRLSSIGGYSGWGGLLYTYLQLGALWKEAALIQQARAVVAHISDLIERDEVFDIIGGAAGCIGSLLSLYRYSPSETALGAAIRCGERLISHAQRLPSGCGWLPARNTPLAAKPLAGFAHGASGIAWALLELAAVTHQSSFETMALEAIAYERSLFSPAACNWPDLRLANAGVQDRDPSQQPFMTAWCHGAAGIGLARLEALKHINDPLILEEAKIALKTTLAQGFGLNHSLCHGDMGNLELLLRAGEVYAEGEMDDELDRLKAALAASLSGGKWACGTPTGIETPGLMTGLAGIGYGLLRLAEPDKIPCILTLAPPTSSAGLED